MNKNSQFCITSNVAWRKWRHSSRLDVDPDEFFGQLYRYGAMHEKTTPNTPFINAELFLQKAGHDISSDLTEELDCCEEFCMERISVNEVFDQIKLNV